MAPQALVSGVRAQRVSRRSDGRSALDSWAPLCSALKERAPNRGEHAVITSRGLMLRASFAQLQEIEEPGLRQIAEEIAKSLYDMQVVPLSLKWRGDYVRIDWWCPNSEHEYFCTYQVEPRICYWLHLDEVLSAMVVIQDPPSKG